MHSCIHLMVQKSALRFAVEDDLVNVTIMVVLNDCLNVMLGADYED